MRGGGMFNNVRGPFERLGRKVTNAASEAIEQVTSAASGLAQNAQKRFFKPPSNPFKKNSTPTPMNQSMKSNPSRQPKPSMRF
jgi:hypothetical protein